LQENLDEYLSVCQLGITLASIALGFVGEPAFAVLVQPVLGSWAWAHAVAIAFAYLAVSFLHVLLGEQVPKLLAIRAPAAAARRALAALAAVRRDERLGAPGAAAFGLERAGARAGAQRGRAARDPRAVTERGLALVPPAPPDGERLRPALRAGARRDATARRCRGAARRRAVGGEPGRDPPRAADALPAGRERRQADRDRAPEGPGARGARRDGAPRPARARATVRDRTRKCVARDLARRPAAAPPAHGDRGRPARALDRHHH